MKSQLAILADTMDEMIPSDRCWKDEFDVTPHYCCDWTPDTEPVTPRCNAAGYDTCWDFMESYLHNVTQDNVGASRAYNQYSSTDPHIRKHGFGYYDDMTCCPHYQTSRGRTNEFVGIHDVKEGNVRYPAIAIAAAASILFLPQFSFFFLRNPYL